MRILLDMDGPLAAFDEHAFAHCGENGWTVDVEGPHAQTARYMTDHVADPNHRRALRKIIDSAGWFRSLPVTAGAIEGVAALEAAGHDVWVCTKPLEVNPTCRDEKGAWLAEHFPHLERKLIIAPDKSLVMGDILIDDAPKPEWFPAANWEPIIFDAPYNREGTPWEDCMRWSWGDDVDDLTWWWDS